MDEPNRAHLPIRREAFQGVTNRTLEGSKPDWNLIGTQRRRRAHPTSCWS